MHSSKCVVIAIALAAVGIARADLNVGQIDTFEDSTTMGWTAGGQQSMPPIPPTNIATGGPTGIDDNYLQITALGGNGPGSKLSAFNLTQWAGDYTAAGVTFIRMDLRNFGPDDASIRLLLADPVAGPPSNIAITNAVSLPAGGGWTSATFAIDASSLTTILGDPQTALANATELRIFHNPDPDFPGPPNGIPPVNLVLGVDNVVALPEPASVLVMGSIMVLGMRRRK